MASVSGTDHWRRLEQLFYAALDLEAGQRVSFLDEACNDEVELRREVESLLDSSEKTLGFLRNPVHEAAQDIMGESESSGKRIGAYQLIRAIGNGGMGKVYLAARADDLYHQQVAIKLLHPGLGATGSMLLRFSAERQILANLNHPNIARLLDGGITAEGLPYLVMEYVDGVPIDEFCNKNRVSTENRLKLFCTVCAAVDHAHKNLVIHRDIKPANILVTPEGVPKLLDFGIAKLLDPELGNAVLTRTIDRMMTPVYASPEQVRGEPVTTAADVYALGVLLYELLAGERPFQSRAKSTLELAQIICEEIPQPPSKVITNMLKAAPSDANRKLSGDLDNIVLMAIRKEAARRYLSVSELSSDIQAYLEGYPVRARTDTYSYRASKFVRRHKVGVAMAAVAVLALIGFSVGMGVLAKRATKERLAAQQGEQFLESIFQAAMPDVARGRQITAHELLDQAAKRIDGELATQPELQAAMLSSIGIAYFRLGQYQQAQPLLERAYALRKKELGAKDLDVAETAGWLGTLYRMQGKYQEAEPLFRQSLSVRQKALGENSPLVAQSLNQLGECLYLENADGESETLLRRALTLNTKLDSQEGALTRNYLAEVLVRKGDFPEAAQLLRDSVEGSRRIEGEDSPDFAIGLHNLAGVLIDLGDLSGAEAMDKQAVGIQRKILGNDHPDLAYALNNVGTILLAKGEWKQAEPWLWEALTLRRKQLGEKHPMFAASLNNWARVLQAKGDYSGAETCYRQAMQIMQEAGQTESWIFARLLANFGLLQLDRGDYAAAENYARQALQMRLKLGGDENTDVASSLIDVAVAREFQNDFATAEPLLRQALEIRKKKFSSGHPGIIAVEVRLGEALTKEGKPEMAEPLLQGAMKSAQTAPFPLSPWQTAEVENTLGTCLASLGRSAEAELLLRNSGIALRSYPDAALRRRYLQRLTKSYK